MKLCILFVCVSPALCISPQRELSLNSHRSPTFSFSPSVTLRLTTSIKERLPVLTGYFTTSTKEHRMCLMIYGSLWWFYGKKEHSKGCGVGQVAFPIRWYFLSGGIFILNVKNTMTRGQVPPISLLHVEDKIFFRVVARRLVSYLKANSLTDISVQKSGIPGFPEARDLSMVFLHRVHC